MLPDVGCLNEAADGVWMPTLLIDSARAVVEELRRENASAGSTTVGSMLDELYCGALCSLWSGE